MNKRKLIFGAGLLVLTGIYSSANEIRFDKPATANGEEDVWVATDRIWQNYSLPVGNGSMGITTYGGVEQEVLYLTTDTVWTGKFQPNADNENAYDGINEIRRLLMADKYDEAEALSRKHLGSTGENKAAFGSFSVIGRILIDTDLEFSDVSNYQRALNLDDAIATVSYEHGETRYDRELFASYPDQAAVIRYAICGEASQNLRISFETPHNTEANEAFQVSVENDDIVIIGQFAESGLQIDTRIRVRAERGEIVAGPDYLEIKEAGTVEIFVAADTSHDMTVENLVGEPKTAEVLARLDRAVEHPYGALRARHLADYHELFNRVTLDLGATNASIRSLPMNERLERYAAGANDPELEAMIFQFGRYLMIASSRPGSLPANLQGVWSNSPMAPWEGDYHLDINLQMNYWLTGVTNLIECQEPLIDFLELLQRNGSKTAHAYYRADGWTATLLSNAWGYTSPNFTLEELERGAWNPRRNRYIRTPMYWNYFPSVGPWIAHHAYDHFAYNQDRNQLEEQLWPILSSSADFVCDFLFQLPSGHYTDLPSWSPEHGRISKGATASIAISREVLQASLELAGVLGIENEQTRRYREVLENLLPYRIGQHGQLQEWYEDRDRVDDQHRHVNHLIGLHPGSQISPLTTPELAEATRVTLSHRGAMSTGWSLAWKMNLMARLLDGEEAYNMLRLFLEARVGANLYCMHPPFQIDGNFGVAAAIGEMLLQSHLGEIHLLPALAESWPSGQVKGLRARGGFEVDITWSDHQLVEGAIRAITDGTCRIRVDVPVRVEFDGEPIAIERTEDGVLSFPAEKGKEYTLVAIFGGFTPAEKTETELDLSGEWRLLLDSEDQGVKEQWYLAGLPGAAVVSLPGSLQAQGFGDDPGPDTEWIGQIREEEWSKEKYAAYRTPENFKMPFWLQPDKHYMGAAWYQKQVHVPAEWRDQHVELIFERPHWETTVWINDQRVGSNQYLSVAHVYDLTDVLTPGEHTITVRVDNRMVVNVGPNSHSVSDHTQSNWNGIVGQLKLKARPMVRIGDVQVFPDLDRNGIRVVAQALGDAEAAELMLSVSFQGEQVASESVSIVNISSGGKAVETFIEFEQPAKVWDEFHPHLYLLDVRLNSTDSRSDTHSVTFGMREIRVDENRMLLNGRPIVLRGTLECAIFPETGYPPTDVESWKRIIRICKEHGLNHIRFHSWCPPKAAFVAADELGFYFQVECSTWPNQGAALGRGQPVDEWLYEEAEAILRDYGNHPSFLLFASGNEPGGPQRGAEYLREWVPHFQAKDSRRLVTSAAGWPAIPENDFHNFHSNARIQGWGAGLSSRINSQAPETVSDFSAIVAENPDHPVVVHEIGQWCVYPNFAEVEKYTGVLKPRNFEVFADFLEKKNLSHQAEDFLMASGKLQVLCYKEEIEANLRTKGYGGFQLLDLRDFPGQGTALVGVLDPFWDPKPYVTAEEFRRFCAPIVPLARLPKFTYTTAETFSAEIELSQFGAEDLNKPQIRWVITDRSGQVRAEGLIQAPVLPTGDLYTLGNISVDLQDFTAPEQYHLEVSVLGSSAINGWDFWVYPEEVATESANVIIARELTDEVIAALNAGGRVLLSIDPTTVRTDVALGFSSIFWNTAWTAQQAPHTLGILCDPAHPALARFPTEYHSNWQWSLPIQHAATMELDHLPKELKPIIQIVPDWFEPKKLALAFEAHVAGGKLLVTSVDLTGDLDGQLERRQLLASFLNYMKGEGFDPSVELSVSQVQSLFK